MKKLMMLLIVSAGLAYAQSDLATGFVNNIIIETNMVIIKCPPKVVASAEESTVICVQYNGYSFQSEVNWAIDYGDVEPLAENPWSADGEGGIFGLYILEPGVVVVVTFLEEAGVGAFIITTN